MHVGSKGIFSDVQPPGRGVLHVCSWQHPGGDSQLGLPSGRVAFKDDILT
jgi:hypothetical protein